MIHLTVFCQSQSIDPTKLQSCSAIDFEINNVRILAFRAPLEHIIGFGYKISIFLSVVSYKSLHKIEPEAQGGILWSNILEENRG